MFQTLHEISKNLIFVFVWKYVWKYVNINVKKKKRVFSIHMRVKMAPLGRLRQLLPPGGPTPSSEMSQVCLNLNLRGARTF